MLDIAYNGTMLELHHPIGALKGVGPKTVEVFYKHGIRTVEDLLYFWPRAWIDASQVTPLCKAKTDQAILCQVRVVAIKSGISYKNRLPFIRATLADATGSIDAMWFRQPYLKNRLKNGIEHWLYGRVHQWRAGERLLISPKFMTGPEIMPVYSEIGGLTSEKIRRLVGDLLPICNGIEDHIANDIRQQLNVLELKQALKTIHAPNSLVEIQQAKDRFGIEELIMTAVPGLLAKQAREKEKAQAMSEHKVAMTTWVKSLPFELTNSQKAAIDTIIHDLTLDRPMNRLLQGDVGSGKTVVALAASLETHFSGRQVVWLAPTELLACQHYAVIKNLLNITDDCYVALWTGSVRQINGAMATRDKITKADIIIGTHAVLQHKMTFDNLGLLIIDEQHRFGVKQRALLRKLSGNPVHLLSMTATPIPRTMALTMYGDLDISTLVDKPLGRKHITTRVVEEANRDKAYEFIDKHIAAGRQVYVVCPMIEPSKDAEANVFVSLFQLLDERKAVKTQFEEMQKKFPNRQIGLLHGKMKPGEKSQAMNNFRAGKTDILVSTSVIEVGVDVPNVTIMVIESAERFGLATLHQLRGRVGRSDMQSFCMLFPSSDSKKENARLQLLESTNDGFILAEEDLKLRGPGELTGLAQSGLPRLKFATFDDLVKVEKIKTVLPKLIEIPRFREAVDRFWRLYHPE